MKKVFTVAVFSLLSFGAFAQTTTTTNNTTTSNTAVDGSTNVIVSTPNGTIGNQVNSPANSNNVYVVNGHNSNDRPDRYSGRYRDALDRDELMQRRYEREYDAAMQNHDYRDRPNYYDIRGNQDRQFNQRNQPDYHSGYRTNNGSQNYRNNANSHYRARRTSR